MSMNDERVAAGAAVGSTELLGCPFCGGVTLTKSPHDPWQRIRCSDCLAIGPCGKGLPQFNSDQVSTELWNQRANRALTRGRTLAAYHKDV